MSRNILAGKIFSAVIIGSIFLLPTTANADDVPGRNDATQIIVSDPQNPNAVEKETPAQTVEWYELASDNKYTKYFKPSGVKVTKKAKTESGKEVPTEIEALTMTKYSYEGAADTIKNYGITSVLSDPKRLAYSTALLRVNPQNRTVQYAREDFFDPQGKIIWSKTDDRIREINSRSFDEDFYVAIIDTVFRQGELARKNADNRWIDLWTNTDELGITTTVSADTTTMQLKGTNLVLWEWQEKKDSSDKTLEIRFMKKSVNLAQGSEKITSMQVWNITTKRFRDVEDEYGGHYQMIKTNDPEYKGLVRLRAFAKGYSTWVTRYSIS